MRHLFAAHIPPSEEDFDTLWREGLVIADTNILLDLYRYSRETREQSFKILDDLADQLWLPNQVAWEFFNNRAASMTSNVREIIQSLEAALKPLEAAYSSLEKRGAEPERLTALIAALKEEKQRQEDTRDATFATCKQTDDVLLRILRLYDQKVGPHPTDETIAKLCQEGERRYQKNIPPGFEDAARKKSAAGRSRYGDYILWHEILQHCVAEDRPAIIVTNDRKDDWFERVSGRTLGPRRELLFEFQETVGKSCWIYPMESFLRHASERFDDRVSPNVLDEVKAYERRHRIDELIKARRSRQIQDYVASEAAQAALIQPELLQSLVYKFRHADALSDTRREALERALAAQWARQLERDVRATAGAMMKESLDSMNSEDDDD